MVNEKSQFDVEKFLDSLTIEELRSFARVGVATALSVYTKTLSTLLEFVRSKS